MRVRLEQEIVRELAEGDSTLLPGDQHRVHMGTLHLLNKSLDYKKAWLLNVSQAQERYHQLQAQDDDLITRSRENSILVAWMEGQTR